MKEDMRNPRTFQSQNDNLINVHVVLSCMLAATEIHEMHELQRSETLLECSVMIQKT